MMASLRGVFQKKKRYFLGIFPKMGGHCYWNFRTFKSSEVKNWRWRQTEKLLTFVCDVLWIPNIAESFWWSNSPSRNCVSKIAKYAHFCRKNHNMNKRASKFCTFFRPFVHFWENLYIPLFVSNRNRSPALSILCTAIQHGKMPQVGIGTKILECLYL